MGIEFASGSKISLIEFSTTREGLYCIRYTKSSTLNEFHFFYRPENKKIFAFKIDNMILKELNTSVTKASGHDLFDIWRDKGLIQKVEKTLDNKKLIKDESNQELMHRFWE
ncbi:MAG: hypothetical protein EOM50_09275 [Erysipelotrichia bacterium]|nr:hypothetical protein [Erysipelotrichia bacterium]